MSEPRGHLERRELLAVARTAFAGRELISVQRLRGGTKKGVYRLLLDDHTTSIAYVWNADEDYWPTKPDQDPGGPFGHASGLGLFTAAHTVLSEIGIRVPRLIMLDASGDLVSGEVAVLEDVRGGTVEDLWERDPQRAEPVLARLGAAVQAMHHHRNDWYGRPGANGATDIAPVEHIVLHRALDHLSASAARLDRIAAVEQRVADTLTERYAAVAPRREYGLIHGELGPDHVLVDDQHEPVLIDIEGVMFFDVEWEHAFLELRFGDSYRHLSADDLDGDRLRFYRLAMYLSLVAGPLDLLDGDFPHRAAMQDIVEQNVGRTLAELS
ncbi:phosphotransferase [Saccharopolyspora sp. 5N708]|uniref:phosphotransferase n=1 Tax=Saccharopolyspora sp. 5N708 TaxID=3457424 RepID=UPI003FD0D2F5